MNDQLVAKYSLEIQEELPTIYMSIENLISYILGKNYEQTIESGLQIAPQNVMACARYVLQAIRTYKLPPVEEYCAQFPGASADDIAKYTAAYEVRQRHDDRGGKCGRIFGRSYLHWTNCWPAIRQFTFELIQQHAPNIPMADRLLVIGTYERSILVDEFGPEPERLIWSSNINIMMSGMQRQRNRTSTDDLSMLENQLFISPTASISSKIPSRPLSTRAKQPPQVWTHGEMLATFGLNSSCNSPTSTVDRSRAPTMEHMGLEFAPDMMRSRSFSHEGPPYPVFPIMTASERSRSTTLDLFNVEHQPELHFAAWSSKS